MVQDIVSDLGNELSDEIKAILDNKNKKCQRIGACIGVIVLSTPALVLSDPVSAGFGVFIGYLAGFSSGYQYFRSKVLPQMRKAYPGYSQQIAEYYHMTEREKKKKNEPKAR